MVRQLLWREFREQRLYGLGALVYPPAWVLFTWLIIRLMDPSEGLSLDYSSMAPLAALLFVPWGAMAMWREREPGRLTLFTLPLPWWRIWTAKVAPALAWAVICAAFHYALSTLAPTEHTWRRASPEQIWIAAGAMAMAYSASLAAALLWGLAPAIIVGGLVVFLGAWQFLFPFSDQPPSADLAVYFWLVALALAAFAAYVMSAWARGASTRRLPWPVGAALVAVVAFGVFPAFTPAAEEAEEAFYPSPPGPPVVSQSAGLVAYTRGADNGDDEKRYELWVCRLDGAHERLVTERGTPVVLIWTPDGRLVFRQLRWRTRQDSLVICDAATGKARTLLRRPIPDLPLTDPSSADYLGAAALEPGGGQVALIYPSQRRFPFALNRELWAVDLRTGKRRLVHPNALAEQLFWRGGRIYLKGEYPDERLWSVPATGGLLRGEAYLPPAEEGPP